MKKPIFLLWLSIIFIALFSQTANADCIPFNLPYHNDFSTQEQFDCWSNNGIIGGFALNNYEMLKIDVFGEVRTASMPASTVDINGLTLNFLASFHLWMEGEVGFEVGVMADKDQPESFVSQQIFDPHLLTQEQSQFQVIFKNIPETHRIISFKITANGDYGFHAFIDDVNVEEAPDCIQPIDLHKVETTSNSIVVEWTEQATAEAWELLYNEEGFDISNSGILVSATSVSHEISGLISGKTYDVYVRSVCGDEGSSAWTGPLSVFLAISGDNCETAINLSNLTSSYKGSADGAISDFDFCNLGSKRDLVFYYDVAADAALEVWESQYYFYPISTMRWGDTCPGENEIACGDTDQGRVFWTNNTGSSQRVWFLLAGDTYWNPDYTLNWKYYTPGFCIMPSSLSLDEVTTHSAKLSWSAQYSTGPWEVAYGSQGFNMFFEGERFSVETPEIELVDLDHSQKYDVYVRALCGTDKESTWTKKMIMTECGIWDLPYEYNFSEYEFYKYSCWDYTRQGSSAYFSISYERLEIYATDANIVLSTPEMGVDLNGLLLSFNGSLVNDATSSGSLEIGVMSDPNDMSSFISKVVYNASDLSKDLMHFRVVLKEIPETHRHIGFKLVAQESVTQVNFYLDDVVLDVAPDCISPQLLRRRSATSESLIAEWQEVGEAQQWELIYGLSGFNVENEGTSVVANSTNHEIDGLVPGEAYEFYVRSICGEKQHSNWSRPVTMKIPVLGDNCSNAIDLSELSTPYFGSIVKAENDFSICGLENSNDLVFYYDIEPGAGLELLHLYDNYYSSISLRWGGACPGENEILCGTDIHENRQKWVNETDEIQRVWLIEGASYNESGEFVLQWKYFAPGHCFAPTTLMATGHTEETVKLSWVDKTGADEWELVYGLQGFNVETDGERLIIQEPYLVLEGLQHSSTYDYYVRSVCGTNNYSSWASSNFNTNCGVISLPYSVGFDNKQEIRCWKYLDSGWNDFYCNQGTISYNVNPGAVALHVLPDLSDIPANTLVRVKPLRSYGDSGIFEIGTLSDRNDSTTFVAAATYFISEETYPSNSSGLMPFDFAALMDQKPEEHSHIAIRIVNTGTEYLQLSVDAIEILAAQDYILPVSFRVEELTSRSAILSWKELGSADEWEVRIASLYSNTEIEEKIYTVKNTTFEVEGLKPGSSYQTYVRTTGAELNAWAGPLVFHTPYSCPSPIGVSAERISESSVLVSWQAEEGIEEWNLRYTNLSLDDIQSVTVKGNSQYLLEQLDPEDYYELFVQAICSGEDEESWFSNQVIVPGVCADSPILPYSENFKVIPNGSLPVCWDKDLSSDEIGAISVKKDYNLGKHLYFDVQGSQSYTTAIMPAFDQSIENVRVSFKVFKPTWNGNKGTLQVGLQNKNGFVELETIVVESSSMWTWKEQRVYLRDVGLNEGRLAFRLVTDEYDYYCNLYLTDVKVEVIPDIIEPHGLRVDNLKQTTGEISWLQFETADKVEVVWGSKGFDPTDKSEKERLAADALNYQLTGLLPNTAYDLYVRNVTSDEQVSSWAGPLQLHTPCEPMQIHLLNIDKNEVLSAGEDQMIRFSYNYLCYGDMIEVILVRLDDDERYSITDFIPASETGEFEFVLPETLWGGNYAIELRYQDYDSHGLPSEIFAQSETFLIENKYPQIEIKRPTKNSIAVVEGNDNDYFYLAWNVFALNSVKLEYTLDGGESWHIITKSFESYRGYSSTGYSSHRYSVAPSWVGKTIQFKVSSVFSPDVFDISEEVLVMNKYPFNTNQGFSEVPLGTNFEIAYEMSFPGWIEYGLNKAVSGSHRAIVEEYLEEGSGVLKIATDHLEVGTYYYVQITGPGWNKTYFIDFEIINPTNVKEQEVYSPEVVLYPVPTEDLLYIKAPSLNENTRVLLYDLSGRRLMELLLSDTPLNLTHLNSGVYLLVLDGQTYKVVKQ